MKYRPDTNKTAVLSTGKPMHLYADHPNHTGFSPQDHALAADYHNRLGKGASDNNAALFHFAQRDLHALASKGQRTKIGHVPSEVVLSRIAPEKQAFWRKRAADQQQINTKLKAIDKYRMHNVLSGDDEPEMHPSKKIFNIIKASKSLNKSRTTDIQLANKVERDRQPPAPPLTAKDADNSIDPEYQEILKTVLAKRKAERHSEGDPVNASSDSNVDPRKQISTDQLDKIREAIANRNRGG